jgi:hypothetical protein
MFKKSIYLLFGLIITTSFAAVPIDTSLDTANTAAMANYTASVSTTLSKITDTMQVTQQLQNLHGLQKLQGASNLCKLCQASEQAQLQAYSNSINDDLCSQFSTSYQNLTGVQNAAKSLGDIMKLMTVNPKAAAMALQQAAIAAQATTNSTLAQMQLMSAQSIQKNLADEKIKSQSAKNISEGLKSPGL